MVTGQEIYIHTLLAFLWEIIEKMMKKDDDDDDEKKMMMMISTTWFRLSKNC